MTRFYRLMVATAAIFGVTSAARADGPASGEVTGVSVQASPGRADVIVNVRGAVEVRDFMLQNPNRLVLDIVGAKLKGNSTSAYDGVRRAGVLNLRYSQFAPNVVRVVLDLDRTMDYHVERLADAIRVSFGTDQSFLAWSSSDTRQSRSLPRPRLAGSRRCGCRPAACLAPPPWTSRGSRSCGTAPASPMWSPVLLPSAGAPSFWARTSRAKSRPRFVISHGPRHSRQF
jgi:hypothetical protein